MIADAHRFTLAVPLDIDGVTVEGLELRGGCIQDSPDRAVGLHLQYHPAKRPCTPLARAEWRPLGAHTNPNYGPRSLRLLRIEGSHLHSFDLNWLEGDGRMRAGNLPLAQPLDPDAANLDAFLAFVGKEFRIMGLDQMEPPAWRLGNLFG